ncbi:MAG: ATP-binding domain-containing protein, partial [Deltaproteobacteria bacterium]
TGNVHGFSQIFSNFVKEVTGYTVPVDVRRDLESGLQDCIVQLQQSFRFGIDSGIGAVGRAVNEGDGAQAIGLLRQVDYEDIGWRDLPRASGLPTALRRNIIDGFGAYLEETAPGEIFQQFDRFRILCALREGPYGVTALNSLVEDILVKHELIEPDKRWYRGRPVMITRNDYNLRLFNGDVGIVLPDPDSGNDLRVFFPAPKGRLRKFHPQRLPEHETVYAMTVHKSQGSEFDRVLLLLPDRESRVLTRELIYTAITRAREGVETWGRADVFQTAISRRMERMSGLRDALWGAN